MHVSNPEEIRAKLEAARVAIAGRLRGLADEIEALPLEDAAEVLSWIGASLADGPERRSRAGRRHRPSLYGADGELPF